MLVMILYETPKISVQAYPNFIFQSIKKGHIKVSDYIYCVEMFLILRNKYEKHLYYKLKAPL